MLLRVIDIETKGLAPPAEVIEIGRVDVRLENSVASIERPKACLYRPLSGIPPETMAVHHITEADFTAETPICSEEKLRLAVWGGSTPSALVAHNCDFERSFIPEAITGDLPWICTHKVALRVWPDAPRHSNQVLRYWLGLVLDGELAMPPHRAGPDAWVTAHILAELAKTISVEQMISWTREPRALPTIAFGKHRGLKWVDIPIDYLQWMLRQTDMDADATWCASQELSRRSQKQ